MLAHESVLSDPRDDLKAGLAGLAHEDLDGFSTEALGEDLIALRRTIDRLEAEFARRLLRFGHGCGYAADNSAGLTGWLRRNCRLSGPAAAERVTVARELPELAHVEASFRRGDISYQNAAVIAHSAAENGADAVRPHEMTLLNAAGLLDPGRLRQVTRRLRYCINPDGALDDGNAQHENRFLHLSPTFEGPWLLDGLLGAEDGALLHKALSALNGPPPSGEARRASARRADALVELATRFLQAGDLPGAHGQRPHLLLTASEAALRGERGAEPAELIGVGAIHSESARRLSCDAAVTPVTVDGSGAPLSVGRTTRTIPPSIRAALILRDRGCVFEGCDRPVEWTDAHHRVHWVEGGETSLENLELLCRRHHRVKHEGAETARAYD